MIMVILIRIKIIIKLMKLVAIWRNHAKQNHYWYFYADPWFFMTAWIGTIFFNIQVQTFSWWQINFAGWNLVLNNYFQMYTLNFQTDWNQAICWPCHWVDISFLKKSLNTLCSGAIYDYYHPEKQFNHHKMRRTTSQKNYLILSFLKLFFLSCQGVMEW